MKSRLYIVSAITAAFMMLQTSVFVHAGFSDVEKHWAQNEINQMVEKKFILGYPDGTFKPDREVTKLDTLIIASRVLGVDNPANAEEVTTAEDTYQSLLSKYNIYGKKEVSFLLSRKVLLSTELDAYLNGDNAKAFTKRYEAAIVFTKLMGKETEVKNKTFVILPFMDSQDIPLYAKPYVEFMNDEGIMNGVTKDKFQPNSALTRAQIATMLLRVSNKMGTTTPPVVTPPAEDEEETTVSGTINYVDKSINQITVQTGSSTKTFVLLSDTPITIDGEDEDFEALEAGFEVTVKQIGTKITSVEAESREFEDEVSGPVASVSRSSPMKISIYDSLEDDAEKETYQLDSYVQVIRNGKTTSFSAVKDDDYVTLYLLSNGKVGKIVAEDEEKTVSGVVEGLVIDDKVYLTVKVDGKSNKYEVVSDVGVERNNHKAEFKEVKIGDEVELTLVYNQVTEIEAESTIKNIEGIITEILISKDSKLTVQVNGKTTQYDIASEVDIRLDDKKSTIYDLRLGQKAEIELDNNVITEIKAKEKIESMSVKGTINSINLSLGVITLTGLDDETAPAQIYINSSTKVTNIEDASTMKLSELKNGQEIVAYGKSDRGVFVTSLIVVSVKD